jgi:hypothetical protein
LRTVLAGNPIDYDGSQLRSGFLAAALGLEAEAGGTGAIGAFTGACDVKPEFVVDLDEVASGEPIRAARMLHFIAEFPEHDLEKAVLRQRLLASLARDALASLAPGRDFQRRGDDIYEEGRKVTISIATLSPRSSLVHFAVNIDASGAPVPARGLNDYAVDPGEFGRELLERFSAEMDSARAAAGKVRGVD